VGRYYTLERNDASSCPAGQSGGCPTQQYYHIPAAWLMPSGNTLTVFEASGATNLASVELAVSTMVAGDAPGNDVTKVTSCEF